MTNLQNDWKSGRKSVLSEWPVFQPLLIVRNPFHTASIHSSIQRLENGERVAADYVIANADAPSF
jgi:hypothetical protein